MRTKVAEVEMHRKPLEEMFYINAHMLQPIFDAVKKYTTSHEVDLAYDILNIYIHLESLDISDFKNCELQIYRLGVREKGTDCESVIDCRNDRSVYVGGMFFLTGYWDEGQDIFTFRLYEESVEEW